MKFKLVLAFALFISLVLFAQKRSLQISDFAHWNRIENQVISNNGKFVAFEINRQKGDGFLIIYTVDTQKSDTIHHGTKPKFSVNSDYVVFNLRVPDDTLRKYKIAKTSKEKMPKESFGVFNLQTGKLLKFENVKSYQMADEQSNWLSFLQEIKEIKKDKADTTKLVSEAPKKKVSPKKKESYKLCIWEPVKEITHTFNNVDSFAVASKGFQTAFYTKCVDSTKLISLVTFNPINLKADTIFSDSVTINRLTLDEPGNQLAYLRSADTASVKTYSLYHFDIKKKNLLKAVDTLTDGIPTRWSPSMHSELSFSRDGSKLFFGTARVVKPIKNDSILDEDKPKLDLWSHTDRQIQPQQLKMLSQKKKQTYQAVYHISEKKFVQLADTIIETVRLYNYKNAPIALGTNNKDYQKQSTWSARYLNDYYLIDLKTGTKTELLKSKNNLNLSPTAKFALYFDYSDSIYYSVDLKKMKTTALTKNLKVKFHDELNDIPADPDPYGIAGWTENDKYVLIYDRFDIWKIDPTGKEMAVNITNGRAENTRYRYQVLDNEINFVPEKIILSAFNEKTNSAGYYSIELSKPLSTKQLLKGDFMLSQLQKAKNADAVIFSTQTVSEFPDVKISNLLFEKPHKISNANPQQSHFLWPTVETVNWNSFAGDSLKGLLYKPENFNPQKKYPMVVYFYEKSSDTEHRYNYPQPSRSIISIPFYASNDYFVFVPDIAYNTGFPGQNAYDAIVSGVRKLTETMPFIDEKHIGLQGQSWGGYQIAYLVTQTDIFAAAMAGAPVSNMTSAYGGIRWGTGVSRMFQYEETQSRIGGTLWEKPLNFIENSPLFFAPKVNTPLLIMANDNDGAVPWYQGIEFFMALYRLGKPVWMLNYNGMDHNIESKYWANRVDLSTRMFGFFNHYLKEKPAPEWMKEGIPAIKKGEVLGY